MSAKLGSPRAWEVGGFIYGRLGGLDWPEEKEKFSSNLCPTYFCCNKYLIRAMLPIYYGTFPQLSAKFQI